jgi:tRNA modification GTPase
MIAMRRRQGPETTIVACATALGRGAIAVLRLSGPSAGAAVESLAGIVPKPRRLTLQTYRDPATGFAIDEGLTAWFPAPRSFTGEDCAEFQVHGGPAVIEAMIRACLQCPDIRLAEPGEFTRRAVGNGRLDLAQAEALADLISAETEGQRHQALGIMRGSLGEQIRDWRRQLVVAASLIEAQLDFADEADIDSSVERQSHDLIASVRNEVDLAVAGAKRSIQIRNGFVVALAGPPNAGKSTLINRLAAREVSIVSPYKGTTRDAIEARCAVEGHAVNFVDLAGLRETTDPIERIGVERAQEQMRAADLVLWLSPSDEPAPPPPGFDCLIVVTKSDLAPVESELSVSARTGDGLPALLKRIAQELQLQTGKGDGIVSRERQRLLLVQVCEALCRAESQVGMPELAAEDLRIALDRLGMVVDPVANDEILDHLFASYCIGK